MTKSTIKNKGGTVLTEHYNVPLGPSPASTAVTVAQMKEADRLARATYGLSTLLLMENAGRAVAEAARDLARKSKTRKMKSPNHIAVLCGGGNNGGDGIVAARYLLGWGFEVQVYWLKDPMTLPGDALQHYEIAKRMGVPFMDFTTVQTARRLAILRGHPVIIDALLGTGMQGDVREPYRSVIDTLNMAKRPVVAVDVPSGLDADRGVPQGNAVKANVTVTMAAAKIGFLQSSARPYVGRLLIADIGFPATLLSVVKK